MTGFVDPLGSFVAEIECGAGLQEPTPEDNRFEAQCREAQLDIDKEIPAPPVAIYIGDSPACTFGNFSASIGKPKGKKTFNVSALVAVALTNSTVLSYRGNMPSTQNRILYFDTEQSTYHAHRVFKRIARLTGLPNVEIKRRIQFYALRRYSVEDRIAMIDHLIRNSKCVGLVIIDGIRDLMLDINSPREATQIVNYLMKWTEEYNLHIHTIIHQNKGDENARGHICTDFDITVDIHRRVLSKVFPTSETLLRRGQLEDALRDGYGEEGIDLTTDYRIDKLVKFLCNKRMIEQVDIGKKKGNPFRFLKDFHY